MLVEYRLSTPRSRELGAELSKRRYAAGLTGITMGERLGCDPSQISRVESGERSFSDVELATYLALCQVDHKDMQRMMELAHEPDNGYRIRKHGGHIPDELSTLIFQETNAISLQNYQPMFIPGLAQTEPYARAQFLLGQRIRTPSAIEAHVRARMRRQELLNLRDAPQLTFYVHEHALRTTIGSAEIMQEQLVSLQLLSNSPNVQIRVIRVDAAPFGILGGPFMMMRYAKHAPVVCVEQRTTTMFLERRSDIQEYGFALDLLAKCALNGAQSRQLLDTLSREYATRK